MQDHTDVQQWQYVSIHDNPADDASFGLDSKNLSKLDSKNLSELESDLRDTVDWGKKWLVDFNAGKTQLVLFTGLITMVLLM